MTAVSATDKFILIERLRAISYDLSDYARIVAGYNGRKPAAPDTLPALISEVETAVSALNAWMGEAREVVQP